MDTRSFTPPAALFRKILAGAFPASCKWLLCGLLFLYAAAEGHAQFDAQFSQYWAVTGYYNPAHAGQSDRLVVESAYSQQMSGFENAPKTMYFGANVPFKLLGRKQGVGAMFVNDQIGFFTNMYFGVQYSMKFNLFGGTLGPGIQLGMVSVGFDPSDVTVYDEDSNGEGSVGGMEGGNTDEAIPTSEESGTAFDAGVGVFYTHPWFYAGISATHLLSPTVNWGETNEYQVKPTYYLTAGSNIKTKNPFLTVQPSLLVKSDFEQYKIDLTGRVTYDMQGKELTGGLSYSPGTSVTFIVGGMIKNVRLSYSYELFTNGIGASGGSHDIVFGYSMDMNFGKKAKNKHKSVRIL